MLTKCCSVVGMFINSDILKSLITFYVIFGVYVDSISLNLLACFVIILSLGPGAIVLFISY